jgi:4-alpha-glucanotransferase
VSKELDRLAEAYGISLGYMSEAGDYRHVSERAKKGILAAMGVAVETERDIASSLAAAPAERAHDVLAPARSRCFVPDWLRQGRAWGITCQLYGLRSARNCGIGDFEDLARLAECAGACGADFLGVSPLHALFLADPSRRSPYSPSSRRFLNPLYVAIDKLGGVERSTSQALAAVRNAGLVDYSTVGKLKRDALAARFADFERADLARGTENAYRFEAFCRDLGEGLELFARYEALSEALTAEGYSCGWHSWPDGFRSPTSEEVIRFARDNPARVLFHKWLQWIADEQLAEAQRRARGAGMRIGLFLDLAVGVAPDGSDTWAAPDTVIGNAHVGSPPDPFNAVGQDWGISPLSPVALLESDGGAVAEILRGLMRHAGAIRIDHVMGIVRLYWIPANLTPLDGAYVSYPGDVLLRQLASASRERSVLVIGEDLGTVPAGLRDVMRDAEIQGYRVLYFERDKDGAFRAPGRYSPATLACVSTHDLPTVRGWWTGRDIAERERLGLFDAQTAMLQHRERARDRRELSEALRRAGLASGASLAPPDVLTDAVLIDLHTFLARTRSRLVAAQLEDLVGMEEQANLPGTVDEHPNWRRKLPLTLEDLPTCETFRHVTAALSAERPRM